MNSLNLSKNPKSDSILICGIDEAGRGPVLGPMVLCGVCFTNTNISLLSHIGVKDSKKLSREKRRELSKIIKKNCYSHKILIIDTEEIDNREEQKITMNKLEELKMAEIINFLKPDEIYIDAADVNEDRFGISIKKLLKYDPKKIVSRHKADNLYPIVSAASIIAKHKRDTIIEELKIKFGDFGSGYPSDNKTIEYLQNWARKKKNLPPFTRKTWDTAKKIFYKEVVNKKITEYLK
ncbi:MAG: ribonuclease HII [Candidatus Hodarchaeota archaeon]